MTANPAPDSRRSGLVGDLSPFWQWKILNDLNGPKNAENVRTAAENNKTSRLAS
jgi:hypothetical protein